MSIVLPTKKTPPVQDPTGMTALIYGPTKIGKSTFCASAPEVLFLATEPGLNHLETYEVTVGSWEDLLQVCALLTKGEHPYQTVCIDTIDNAYKFCREHVCKKNGVTDPSDLAYGKGHAMVNNEFQRVLTKLAQLPFGLWLVSHSQEIEVQSRRGAYTKIVPTMGNKARQITIGLVDLVLYAEMDASGKDESGAPVERRVIRTKPTTEYEAGDRTGKLPSTLPLEYAAFEAAWEAAKSSVIPHEPEVAEPATSLSTAA